MELAGKLNFQNTVIPICTTCLNTGDRDNIVNIVTRLRAESPRTVVLFLAEAKASCLLHSDQTGSGGHPPSYAVGIWDSFTRSLSDQYVITSSDVGDKETWN